jgi:hypothetical protein
MSSEKAQEQPPKEEKKVGSILTAIFKSIATEETEIERLRQELAQTRNFEAQILFNKINTDGNSSISDAELLTFLKDNGTEASVEDCQAVIAEFDSSGDKQLQYDEFLNMMLPAANESLREYVLYGRRGFVDPRSPVEPMVVSIAAKILKGEVQLQ